MTELGVPAPEHVVPQQPSFPAIDELIRVASRHDLRPVGPPMSAEEAATILVTSQAAAPDALQALATR